MHFLLVFFYCSSMKMLPVHLHCIAPLKNLKEAERKWWQMMSHIWKGLFYLTPGILQNQNLGLSLSMMSSIEQRGTPAGWYCCWTYVWWNFKQIVYPFSLFQRLYTSKFPPKKYIYITVTTDDRNASGPESAIASSLQPPRIPAFHARYLLMNVSFWMFLMMIQLSVPNCSNQTTYPYYCSNQFSRSMACCDCIWCLCAALSQCMGKGVHRSPHVFGEWMFPAAGCIWVSTIVSPCLLCNGTKNGDSVLSVIGRPWIDV